jgi:FKBP-type peptidyl-prolyl cis-trans isomerase SlyD
MIPEFEKQLAGKAPGDTFAFGIKSSDAYGEFDSKAQAQIPIETFIVDGNLATELLQEGKTIPMRDQKGNMIYGKILDIGEK